MSAVPADKAFRVLVVDDDELMRTLMRAALEPEGLEIVEATSGVEALSALDRFKPHLVLLDVLMPIMDGLATCRALRERPAGADTPIVMMTGHDDPGSIEAAYEAGATDFISKPVNHMILRHRVRYILRARAERKAAEERIARLAYYDELTGLPNRAFLSRHLNYVIRQAKRYERAGAVLSVDLDGFKRVNDTLGHAAGDALLCAVAKRLTQCLRSSDCVSRGDAVADGRDTVARFGGDEFIVVLPELQSPDSAAQVAERILASVAQPFSIAGHQVYVTASVGIATLALGDEEPEIVLRNADAALYHAKERGRSTFSFYCEAMNRKARERLELENSLRHALERGEFELHHQAKVDARSGRILGTEALLRWRRPGHGLVPPLDFIPLAEESGLIVPIGAWVMRTACKQTKLWQERGWPDLSVAVNVSARQLRDRHLVELVTAALQESNLAPRSLELEITEGILMDDTKLATSVLSELRAMGVRIAIDDFGTGYSSFGYLRCLPVDTLKVDRSFVRDIPANPDGAAITAAIIAMAGNLRLKVVAEGVETREQRDFLVAQNCYEMQGYLFGRPLAPPAFEQWLSSSAAGVEAEARIAKSA